MSEKLDRIAADLQKAREKRDIWDRRVRQLEQKYRSTENTEIHELVHMAGLTPEQLAALLRTLPGSAPGVLAVDKTNDANNTEKNEEGSV